MTPDELEELVNTVSVSVTADGWFRDNASNTEYEFGADLMRAHGILTPGAWLMLRHGPSGKTIGELLLESGIMPEPDSDTPGQTRPVVPGRPFFRDNLGN